MHINLLVLQYQLCLDKYAHLPRRAPESSCRFLRQILTLSLSISLAPLYIEIKANSFIYALINQVKILETTTNQCRITTMKTWGPTEFV